MLKPLLIYDGDCRFCRRWIERWRGITGDRVEYAPYQEVSSRFPQIAKEEFRSAVQLVESDGKIYRAAEAVFRSLATVPARRWLLWSYSRIPGVRWLTEFFYRLVARHRAFFSKVTYFFWGDDVRRSSYFLSSSLFLRLVGFIYLLAFASLGMQIIGLVGSKGIFPAHEYLDAVRNHTGNERFWLLPTLAWLNSSDAFLRFLCWGGAVFSIFIILGILPAFFLFLNWVFYLSLLGIGGPFLSFQWDVLLVETGFLAIFLAALNFRPKFFSRNSGLNIPRLLLKLLLFKLMFLSGFVKLASHDPTWKNLTALQYHFQTQPLPVWISWYAHHLPARLLTAACFLTLGIELVVPFFIFFPRRVRHFGAVVLIGLQILIFLTGNYNFFNFLAIALCLLVIDDTAWPKKINQKSGAVTTQPNRSWPRGIIYAVGVFVLMQNLGMGRVFESLRIANHYGLFAVMTTERPEIVVEGSRDGEHWLMYEFKYKPGDLNRKPVFVEPFQPRLDWQMWFAALGNWRQNQWFIYFCKKLLEGSPDVLRLLGNNPFPDGPPRYIRSMVYDYSFSSPEEKQKTGAWWHRELKGAYCPVISLKNN